jgi:GDPmannose 4,6-dehydratase
MLQQAESDDYVLATGESHSLREFVEGAFARISRNIEWRGSGVGEVGMDTKSNQPPVSIAPRYFHRISFNELIAEMMDSDMQRVSHARQRYGPE